MSELVSPRWAVFIQLLDYALAESHYAGEHGNSSTVESRDSRDQLVKYVEGMITKLEAETKPNSKLKNWKHFPVCNAGDNTPLAGNMCICVRLAADESQAGWDEAAGLRDELDELRDELDMFRDAAAARGEV